MDLAFQLSGMVKAVSAMTRSRTLAEVRHYLGHFGFSGMIFCCKMLCFQSGLSEIAM